MLNGLMPSLNLMENKLKSTLRMTNLLQKSVQAAKDLIENKKVFALVGSVGTPEL